MSRKQHPSFGQLKALMKQIEDGRVTGASLQAFLDNPDKWVEKTTPDELQQLIEACEFHSVDDDITSENFPLMDDRTHHDYELCEYFFDSYVHTYEAIAAIQEQGLELASLRDLLRWCEKDSSQGTTFSIVALGSSLKQKCPVVTRYEGEDRSLALFGKSGKWIPHWRFLCRRKR